MARLGLSSERVSAIVTDLVRASEALHQSSRDSLKTVSETLPNVLESAMRSGSEGVISEVYAGLDAEVRQLVNALRRYEEVLLHQGLATRNEDRTAEGTRSWREGGEELLPGVKATQQYDE